MIETDLITSDETKVAEKLNNYFVDVIENLEIETFTDVVEPHTNTDTCVIGENESELQNTITKLVSKYSKHPSIIKIKENVK